MWVGGLLAIFLLLAFSSVVAVHAYLRQQVVLELRKKTAAEETLEDIADIADIVGMDSLAAKLDSQVTL